MSENVSKLSLHLIFENGENDPKMPLKDQQCQTMGISQNVRDIS